MMRAFLTELFLLFVTGRCHCFMPLDFSSNFAFELPEPEHKEVNTPDETSGGTPPQKQGETINITSVEERMTSLEEDIRTFVPGGNTQTNVQTSSVDELKELVKQVSDKELYLLSKLSDLATKLDNVEVDELARHQTASQAETERATKAGSDSTTVNGISEKYSSLESQLQDITSAAASISSTKSALYQQVDTRANSPANTVKDSVDEKVKKVEEHNQLVTKKAARLDSHCTTLDLQGLKVMEEAKANLEILDYHRAREAYASSVSFGTRAESVIDGNLATSFFDRSVLHTATENQPWCMIKLARRSAVSAVRLTSRGDCCHERIHNLDIKVLEYDPRSYASYNGQLCASLSNEIGPGETYLAKCQYSMTGRYVRIQRMVNADSLNVAEVQAIGTHLEIEADKAAIQSSTEDPKFGAMMALDADPNTCSQTRSIETDKEQYWLIDLDEEYKITGVKITNRNDDNWTWLKDVQIDLYTTFVSACSGSAEPIHCTTYYGTVSKGVTQTMNCDQKTSARYMKISLLQQTTERLSLCEVNILFSYR